MTTTNPSPWPACPTCDSTGRRCTSPSGEPPDEWHAARTAAWERLDTATKQRLAQIVERPQVRVQLVPGTEPHPRWAIWCEHCTENYSNTAKTDVHERARAHRDAHRTGRVGANR